MKWGAISCHQGTAGTELSASMWNGLELLGGTRIGAEVTL